MARSSSQPQSQIVPIPLGEVAKISMLDRVLRLLDNSTVGVILGIMGGLVGTFLDGRYYALLGLGLSLALFRSKALEGIGHWLRLTIHITAVALAACVLFWVGVQLNKSRPHTYTPADYAAAVKAGTPLPITQQITNVYRTENFGPKEKPPQIEFDSPTIVGVRGDSTTLNIRLNNSGGQTARNLVTAGAAIFSPMTDLTGDEVFKRLYGEILAKNAPTADMSVNSPFVVPTILKSSVQEQSDYQAGRKAIMYGELATYQDSAGRRYYAEYCLFMVPDSLNHTCLRHNKTVGPKT